MRITSPAFGDHQLIPSLYTCDGSGFNPPLHFSDIPLEAETLVMIMDDPDVPKELKPDGVFDHWVVFNIDPTIREFPENETPPGIESVNSAGNNTYAAACPPQSSHRYFFKLYALDVQLELEYEEATKKAVEEAMQGHIISYAELIGIYQRL